MSGARTGVSYWEGAVDIKGTRNGKPIEGRGYLEMTGYSGRALGEMLPGVRFSAARPFTDIQLFTGSMWIDDLKSPVVTKFSGCHCTPRQNG